MVREPCFDQFIGNHTESCLLTTVPKTKVVNALLGGCEGDDCSLSSLSCHEDEQFQNDHSFLAQVSYQNLPVLLKIYTYGCASCSLALVLMDDEILYSYEK